MEQINGAGEVQSKEWYWYERDKERSSGNTFNVMERQEGGGRE
jgi:hypothetical protein